jgi:hypothetical protein
MNILLYVLIGIVGVLAGIWICWDMILNLFAAIIKKLFGNRFWG